MKIAEEDAAPLNGRKNTSSLFLNRCIHQKHAHPKYDAVEVEAYKDRKVTWKNRDKYENSNS